MIDPKFHPVVAQQLLQIFGGNNYHAVGKLRTQSSGMWYDYVQDSPLSTDLIESHLKGSISLGSYPVLEDNMVRWLGWDVDAKEDLAKAKEYASKIIQRIEHLPYAVEFSGGKGYHIFLFLSKPASAKDAKKVAEYIRDAENLPKSGPAHVEVYPKQDRISTPDENGIVKQPGNLLKIPLGQHLTSHEWSKFIDPMNGWEEAPALEPQEILKYRVNFKHVLALAETEMDPFDEITKIIVSEWHDGVRHELALALSGYLSSIGWSLESTMQLIQKVCAETGDAELENRVQTVHNTFKRQAEGKSIAGFSKLEEILHPNNLKILMEQSFRLILPSTALRVERIRLSRGTAFQKRDKIVNLIWTHLTDPDVGKILLASNENERRVTRGGQLFWYDRNHKLVIPFQSIEWHTMMEEKFKIIRKESFSATVSDQLELVALRKSEPVKVYRKAAFLDGKLYVNLGGPKTYVLDGDAINVEFNGDREIFFQSHSRSEWIEPNFDSPQDIWKFLVEDINFSKDMEVNTDPEAQKELLKIWILSTFFGTLIPVRPILTILGERGSGKTTAMQRILKLLEGKQTNVSSLAVDKPDAWRTLIQDQHVIILDNLERIKSVNWLVKELNTVATGGTITIRKLYTSNEALYINLDAFVGVTAIEMPFSDEALFDRLLPLNLDRLEMFVPVHEFNVTFEKNESFFWADLFLKLNACVKEINANEEVFSQPENIRLSDFVAFCKAISDCDFMDRDNIIRGIGSIQQNQSSALAGSTDSVVPILYQWLHDRPAEALREYSPAELFAILKDYATIKKMYFPWSRPNTFALHIKSVSPQLTRQFGFEIQKEYSSSSGRAQTSYNFFGMEQELKNRASEQEAKPSFVKSTNGGKYAVSTNRIAEIPASAVPK